MPYIKPEDRPQYDAAVKLAVESLKAGAGDDHTKIPGHFNYFFTKILTEFYGENLRYFEHNEVIGMLECCKEEFYRRRTAPYEDKCIESNGDVRKDLPKDDGQVVS